VEVKIGVQHAARELVVESGQSAEEIQKAVSEAVNGKSGLFMLSDERGRTVIVPAERLAYVEIGESETRQVGFGAM
jgi:hypothetical protein